MSKDRVIWIDAVKCLAIVMVVLAHILWVTDSEPSQMVRIGNGLLTANRIFASMGVPLFMMVSGVLLLDKKFDTIADIKNFYKRGLLPLLLTAEIWIVVYSIVNVSPFSLKELLLNMSFIHKPEVHLWYVRLIVAYYFLLPLLVVIWKRNRTLSAFFLVVVYVMTFAYNGWLIYKGSDCPTSSSRSYFCYVIYMVAGYTLAKIRVTRFRTAIAAVVTLAGGYSLYATLMQNEYFVWYDNPLLAVSAFGMFYLIRAVFEKLKSGRLVVEMSKMSYGIYLSHFILVYGIGSYLNKKGCNYYVFYLALAAVTIVDAVILYVLKMFSRKFSKIMFRY